MSHKHTCLDRIGFLQLRTFFLAKRSKQTKLKNVNYKKMNAIPILTIDTKQ